MTRIAVYGVGQGLDGRDAAMKATQKALDQLGALRPALGIVFASEEFDLGEVTGGMASLLGETPLWGMSTVRPLAGDREVPRSVVVALVAGSDLKAQAHFWSTYALDSTETARQVMRHFRADLMLPQAVLLAADGVNGTLVPLCSMLADLPVAAGGGLASGGYSSGKTAVVGRVQSGHSALSTVTLSGRFRLGTGSGHGWRDTGLHATIGKTRDVWIQTIDDRPAVELYAQYFGHEPREWAYPPLNEVVRLYPLGIENNGNLLVRSPLRVEVDGSLRMSAAVPSGSVAHLMLGDPQACLESAETAVRHALDEIGPARPLIALALVDLAWLQLFSVRSSLIMSTIQDTLGSIPVVGGYSLGQIARPAINHAPVIYNQSVTILILASQE